MVGSAAAPASAAAATAIVVTLPGGATKEIPSTALPVSGENVNEVCVMRGRAGEEPQPTTHGGMPVAKVFEAAGVSSSFGYLAIPRPNGTVAYLPHEYFYGPSPFEGCEFATFSYDENTKFFRPPLAGDPNDVNGEDFIGTVSGQPLTVEVHEGRVLEVKATASTTSPTAGSPVEFEASVVGGGEFSFVWTFGDGTTATGPRVEHPFVGSGTYLVRVTATGSDESGGESKPVEVVVGNPPTTAAPGATTTPPPPSAKPTGAPGAGREGRGGKGAKPAPSGEGKARKPTGPKKSSLARQGASPKDRSRAAERTPSRTPAAPSTPTTPPPELPAVPPPTLEAGSSRPGSPRSAPSRPAPSQTQPKPRTSPGELVEGRLVGDDLGPATVAEAVAEGSEGQGSRSAAGAVGGSGAGVSLLALVTFALFAGGALFEWRRSAPAR